MGLVLMTNRNYNSVVQEGWKQKVTVIIIFQPPTLTQLTSVFKKKQVVVDVLMEDHCASEVTKIKIKNSIPGTTIPEYHHFCSIFIESQLQLWIWAKHMAAQVPNLCINNIWEVTFMS